MVVDSRGRTTTDQTVFGRQWKERESEISPERTKVWMEPKQKFPPKKVVPVVYYLTRDGHLEHPHFMEVTLSSGDGLYLRDVINRLNLLRGKGMPNLYSWSSKRSYKNGFVWHDLTEDDFIYPAQGVEYVLKGSELLLLHQLHHDSTSPTRSHDTIASTTSAASSSGSEKEMIQKSLHEHTESIDNICTNTRKSIARKKKNQWSSLDLGEYKVYKTESTDDTSFKASDAATQTDDRKLRRRGSSYVPDDYEVRSELKEQEENPPTELRHDEISPPPSSSSPETLENLIKADARRAVIMAEEKKDQHRMIGMCPSGRARASAVLFNLISCGSISVKDYGGHSFVPNHRPQFPGGRVLSDPAVTVTKNPEDEIRRFPAVMMEDKEYFSGSLIETKMKKSDGSDEFPTLKRSSSYNAELSAKLDLAEKELEPVRAKCIPRKLKSAATFVKETSSSITRSAHGSKRITDGVHSPK